MTNHGRPLWLAAPEDEQDLKAAEEGDDQCCPYVYLAPAGVEKPALVRQEPQARHQGRDNAQDPNLCMIKKKQK